MDGWMSSVQFIAPVIFCTRLIFPGMGTLCIGAFGSTMHSSISSHYCVSSHLQKCGCMHSPQMKKKEQLQLPNLGRKNCGLQFHSYYGLRWVSLRSRFGDGKMAKRRACKRSTSVVRAASGNPNMTALIGAIAVPILLVAVTVIVSIIAADKLDDEFMEEVTISVLSAPVENQCPDVFFSYNDVKGSALQIDHHCRESSGRPGLERISMSGRHSMTSVCHNDFAHLLCK
eukprot:Gb_19586 [translate_table: standard]